jgi:hypothetical protein
VDKKLAGFFNRSCVGSYLVVGDVGIATEFGNMKPGVINGPAQAKRVVCQADSDEFVRPWIGLVVRAEFFNLFNTPSFGDLDINTADGASFGTISSTLGNPRIVQFALKYNF